MNRRKFLGVIGAGSGTLLSSARAGTAESSGMSSGTTRISPAEDNSKTGDSTEVSSSTVEGKIALEEHFLLPETAEPDRNLGYSLFTPELQRQLKDMGSGRIAEMDSGGVELAILSNPGPGIQAIPNISQAIAVARKTNDYLADQIAKYPKRLKGFAALPLQEPQAAAQELTRCIKELRFCGALVAGFSQIGDADSAFYYDLPQFRAFWATVQQLDVPFYLHPRVPLPTRQQAYAGHPWLLSGAWGFAAETSLHALRLMGSGLFDEYPKLKVILGHLGEGLPFSIWRVDHRISKGGRPSNAKLPMAHYLRENFYITTSGNFRTQALTDVILEVGADRVLYSVDYPFEDMAEAANWFDNAAISEPDRVKIGRANAQKLFRL
jgi:gamma-resorcylate decarboxylase